MTTRGAGTLRKTHDLKSGYQSLHIFTPQTHCGRPLTRRGFYSPAIRAVQAGEPRPPAEDMSGSCVVGPPGDSFSVLRPMECYLLLIRILRKREKSLDSGRVENKLHVRMSIRMPRAPFLRSWLGNFVMARARGKTNNDNMYIHTCVHTEYE